MAKEVPLCRPAARRAALLHSSPFIFRRQGNDLPSCPKCAPHFFFSLQEKKKRAAPGAKEKEGLGCRRRWTRAPTRWLCAMWQAYASLVQTRMPRTSLSAAAPTVLAETLQGLASTGPAAAVGNAETSQVCTNQYWNCHLAQAHLIEARYWLSLHPSPLLLLHRARRSSSSRLEKKRRGVHDGQASKPMPCRQENSEE